MQPSCDADRLGLRRRNQTNKWTKHRNTVEEECARVGLRLNAKKTEVIAYNIPEPLRLKTRDGSSLKVVPDFEYLGSWVDLSDKDIKVRKALAWKALNGMPSVMEIKSTP